MSRGTVFCSPILGEQNYVYSFPLKQKTSLSPIVSGKEVPGANSPNTEERSRSWKRRSLLDRVLF